MSHPNQTTYIPLAYDKDTMTAAVEAVLLGEPAAQTSRTYGIELRHFYRTIAEDKRRNHVISASRKEEIYLLRQAIEEEKKNAALRRWHQVRDGQLDAAIAAIPHVAQTVDTPGKLYQTVVSAAIATEKAAALAGEPLGTVEHRHTGRIRHEHVVVHVPIYQAEQYERLTADCEIEARAIVTPSQGAGENGDTPA